MKRPTVTVGGAAAAVTAVAMVATPLARQGGVVRRVLTSAVVSGLFTSTTSRAVSRWGAGRGLATAAATAVGTAAVERLGTRTGFPFGRYHYTSRLQPQVKGVPAVVPLAWFAMALPARETAHAALGTRSTRRGRVLLGSAALTAWDLFLDPQMVGEGFWQWRRAGRYRGIPLTNYLGWFATGVVVLAALERALPVDDDADTGLVTTYGAMTAMESVGFAAFFRDRVVAAVGTAAMGPVALLAMWRAWRSRRGHRG
jgi:putative membrane protein